MPCQSCSLHPTSPADPHRRDLLKHSLFASAATLLLSACGRQPVRTASLPLGVWSFRIRPSDFPELAHENGIARVDGNSDKPVAVLRTEGGYTAVSLRCTHAGGTVAPKDGKLVCPRHGAEFAFDGTWVGGRQTTNLRVLQTSYDEQTGILTISG